MVSFILVLEVTWISFWAKSSLLGVDSVGLSLRVLAVRPRTQPNSIRIRHYSTSWAQSSKCHPEWCALSRNRRRSPLVVISAMHLFREVRQEKAFTFYAEGEMVWTWAQFYIPPVTQTLCGPLRAYYASSVTIFFQLVDGPFTATNI